MNQQSLRRVPDGRRSTGSMKDQSGVATAGISLTSRQRAGASTAQMFAEFARGEFGGESRMRGPGRTSITRRPVGRGPYGRSVTA